LREPQACLALDASARQLALQARPAITAIAHDLHPDFYSTRLAHSLAAEWQVPAVGVQHHHAHIAAVMAEHGLTEPVIGLALDGVGMGSDGNAWGGELLRVERSGWERLGHVWPLALPGGDVAARQPWRMLAAVLYGVGRGTEIEARLSPAVGMDRVRMVHRMLDAQLNCPPSTSLGRWFDAAAAALGLQVLEQNEAEAAVALEQQAALGLKLADFNGIERTHCEASIHTDLQVLDLRPLLVGLLDWPEGPRKLPCAAAWFHCNLAQALADWAAHAARRAQCAVVCLGGGCFMNAILSDWVTHRLHAQGLQVYRAQRNPCGDAGLALGQAWVVAHESLSCV